MEKRPMTRSEKFTVGLFGVMTVLIVVPGLVFAAAAIFNTGTIYLPYDFSF